MFIKRKTLNLLWDSLRAQSVEITELRIQIGELRTGLQDQSKEIDKLRGEDKRQRGILDTLAQKAGAGEQLFSVPVQGMPTSAPVIKSSASARQLMYDFGGRHNASLSDLVVTIANMLKIEWQNGTDGRLVAGKKGK